MSFESSQKRIVAVKLLSYGGVAQASLIIVGDDGRIIINPFETETAATSFVGDPVAIVKRGAVDEFLLDDLDMAIRDGWSPDIERRVDGYLRSSGLYADEPAYVAQAAFVVLKSTGCEVVI